MSNGQIGLTLVTGGEVVTIWNGSDGYSRIGALNPHLAPVSQFCWARDDSFIVSASSGGDKVHVTSLSTEFKDIVLAEQMGKTCITVCTQSRNLVAGGVDGSIHVWDVRSQRVKETIQEHSGPVTCVACNCNNNVIASGSSTGEIYISNPTTRQKSGIINATKGQSVKQLRFSHLKKSVLGHVDEGGSVCLWDAGIRVMTQQYQSSHRMSATGLAFSPLNHMLMMSVGLDRGIVCYDITSNKIIRTMQASFPVTCIDLLNDGATFAVGGSNGSVTVYDLRSFASPLHSFQAHRSPITSIGFRFNTTPIPANKISSVLDSAQHVDMSSGEPIQFNSTINQSTLTPANTSSAAIGVSANSFYKVYGTKAQGDVSMDKSSVSRWNNSTITSRNEDLIKSNYHPKSTPVISEIFSPIRDDDGGQQQQPMSSEPVFAKPRPPVSVQDYDNMSVFSPPGSSSQLFSPIQDVLETKKRHILNQSSIANTDASVVRPHSALTSVSNGFTNHQPVVTGLPPMSAAKPVTIKTEAVSEASSSSIPVPDHSAVSVSQVQLSDQTSTTSSHTDMDMQDGSQCLEASGTSPRQPLMPTEYQAEFILRMVRDELDDFREELRMTQLNMHMDMLKQFQIQQAELKSLVETYSINHELVAEIHRLRAENEKLRKTY